MTPLEPPTTPISDPVAGPPQVPLEPAAPVDSSTPPADTDLGEVAPAPQEALTAVGLVKYLASVPPSTPVHIGTLPGHPGVEAIEVGFTDEYVLVTSYQR